VAPPSRRPLVSRGQGRFGWSVALAALAMSAAARAANRPLIAVLSDASVRTAIANRLSQQGCEPVTPNAGALTLGCTDPECFAKIETSCHADYLVRAVIAEEAAGGTLTLTLLDRTGKAVTAIPKLIQPLRDAGVATPERAGAETAAPARSHLASYALLVTGVALLLGSGAVGYAADSDNSALDDAVSGSAPGNIPALRSSLSTEAWISTGLTVAGLAAVAVGVILFYMGGSSGEPQASASVGTPALAWGF
jgi:hypothetical protein